MGFRHVLDFFFVASISQTPCAPDQYDWAGPVLLFEELALEWGVEELPMSTTKTVPGIPEELKVQLRQTLDDLVKGIRRPEKMNAACERMDRMREESREGDR